MLLIAARCRSHHFIKRLVDVSMDYLKILVGVASSHDVYAPLLNRIEALPMNGIYYF